MSILPQNHEEFRSKTYWDDFFLKRENNAFEWYGDYSDLRMYTSRSMKETDNILAIGCGNSNFSSDLYDKGYQNITNLDFSELVIQEMKDKNLSRNKMKWDVGDMTNMNQYENNSYDIIFDKGALDALMSTDSIENKEKAICMFNEIIRILNSNGKYICITLAEHYIIDVLLTYFSTLEELNVIINIDAIESKQESPFIPFYIEITKNTSTTTTTTNKVKNSKNIRLHFDEFGKANPVTSNRLSIPYIHYTTAIQQLIQIQQYHNKQYQLSTIQVGRFEKLHFYSQEHVEIPRFTIFLYDYSENNDVSLNMAVFMVPIGRESDYTFTSPDGLFEIAKQANCKRLLAVCCNRPHIYPNMSELQLELNSIVLSLKLKFMNNTEYIPYMAINTEIEYEVIDTNHTELSNKYIIEEKNDDNNSNTIYRRLIFLYNQNFIQTEVRLVNNNNNTTNKNKNKNKKSKNNKNKIKNSNSDQEGWEFDYSYLDAHHCAAICALTLLPKLIYSAYKVSNPHTSSTTTTTSTTTPTALLIGLGGGALPMCLQRYLPNLHLYMCDLDPSMDTIARQYFGFKCNTRSVSFVADGLEVIEQLSRGSSCKCTSSGSSSGVVDTTTVSAAAVASTTPTTSTTTSTTIPSELLAQSQLDFIFIDADSNDTTLGISAPPAAFLTLSALVKTYSILKPGGGIYINIVARNKIMLAELIVKLAALFNLTLQTPTTTSTTTTTTSSDNKFGMNQTGKAAEIAHYKAEISGIQADLGITTTTGKKLVFFVTMMCVFLQLHWYYYYSI